VTPGVHAAAIDVATDFVEPAGEYVTPGGCCVALIRMPMQMP
jgi:hypothetical protein